MKPVIKAPKGQGELACDPPLGQLASQLALGRLGDHQLDPFAVQLSKQARKDFCSYLGQYNYPADPEIPWVGTGHQPELFHPGVWAKNFIAGGMAKALSAISLHVVVDTDCPHGKGIRLPDMGLPEHPRKAPLCSFSATLQDNPWLSLLVEQEAIKRFSNSLRQWSTNNQFPPLFDTWLRKSLEDGWPREGSPVWKWFQKGRSGLELEWGLKQPPVPMSAICFFPSYCRLVARLIREREKSRLAYNAALNSFRKYHQVHAAGRPVPFLEEKDGWCEIPLWLGTDHFSRRERVWVKQAGGDYILSPNRVTEEWRCPEASLEDGLAALNGRLWPRALFTTLYLRGFVFDWFVHGIGGALYDQVTGEWAERFLNLKLRPMVATSLTLRLPMPTARSSPELYRASFHRQHHLEWNPDRLVKEPAPTGVAGWVSELQRLRRESPSPGRESKNRFRRMRQLISRLRDYVSPEIAAGWNNVDFLRLFASEQSVVASREYAYILHSHSALQKYLQPLLELRQAAASV